MEWMIVHDEIVLLQTESRQDRSFHGTVCGMTKQLSMIRRATDLGML
jgi:hypothetical protein